MTRLSMAATLSALGVFMGVPAMAQRQPSRSASPAPDQPKEFAALKYRSLGPYQGGRVSRAAGVASAYAWPGYWRARG